MKKTLSQKFFERFVPVTESGCWLWTNAANEHGYGVINFGTYPNKKKIYAHRASWEIHRGSIPEGMHVLHKCDVTSCVNPDHLFLGDQVSNTMDKVRKGRQAKGEDFHRKLKEEDVIKIKQSTLGNTELAKAFGVTYMLIRAIKNGTAWRHVA